MDNKIFLALDLETTGFDENKDRIIEVGLVKFNREGELARWSSLVRIVEKLPDKISRLTGISQDDLADASEWMEVKEKIREMTVDCQIIIGHNIAFDIGFLKKNGIDLSHCRHWDTWYLANMLVAEMHSYSLETLSRYINWEHNAHRALDDALAVVGLFNYLKGVIQGLSDEVIIKIKRVIDRGNWLYADVFLDEINQRRDNYSVNRPKIKCQLKIPEYPIDLDDGINLIEISRRELLSALLDGDVAVVSRDEFKMWAKLCLSGFVFIDEQRYYLCRQKLRLISRKIKLSPEEIGWLVKIFLLAEGGWDGYLPQLNLSPAERVLIGKFNCGSGDFDHTNCFYSYKLVSSGKKVVGWPVLPFVVNQMKKNRTVWYWLNDLIPEDSYSALTGVTVNQNLWKDYLDELAIAECFARKRLEELTKAMEMFWGMAQLMVRSQGVDGGRGPVLDFTPAVYQDLSFIRLRQSVQKIRNMLREVDLKGRPQNLIISHYRLMDFWGNWLGENEYIMSGMILPDGEMKFEIVRRDFVDSWPGYTGGSVVLAAPAIFFNNKFYAERLFFDRTVKKIIKPKIIRLELEPKNQDGLINFDRFNFEESNLLVFTSREKAEDFLEKIANKPYYNQVTSLVENRKGLLSTMSGLVVITLYNLRYLRQTAILFDQLYVDGLPFDVPDSLLISYRSMKYGDESFQQYYLPRMYSKLTSLMTLIRPGGIMVFGDSRIWEKDYGQKFLNIFYQNEKK